MNSISEIMERYKAGEITLEEANAELIGLDAGFYLKDLTDEEREAKKLREDEEGMIDIGNKPERLPDRPDMKRRTELAGQTVIQKTKAGRYEVSYDEDGYATKAVRV